MNAAPGVFDPVEVLVAGVAVPDQNPGERRPDASGVDGVLAAVPDVHRGQEPGAGHVQVGQRACGAAAINARTCGRNRVSSSRAAWARSPATHPGDTANPSSALSTRRARRTGRKCAHVSHAARALTPGPYWTRPDATAGAVASVTVPHPPQVRDCTRCSVTYGRGGGGGTSNT